MVKNIVEEYILSPLFSSVDLWLFITKSWVMWNIMESKGFISHTYLYRSVYICIFHSLLY